MKKKFILKIGIDLILSVLLLVLMGYPATTLKIHEIGGIVFLVVIVVHLFLGFKWFQSIVKRIFHQKQTFLTYAKTVMSLLLLIDLLLTGISGILISRTVLTSISVSNTSLWTYIHNISAYAGVIIISIHIGMYWKVVMAFFRKLCRIKEVNVVRTWILRGLALLLAVLGVKSSFDRGIAAKFYPEGSNQTGMKEEKNSSNEDGQIVKNTTTTETDEAMIRTVTYKTSATTDSAIVASSAASTSNGDVSSDNARGHFGGGKGGRGDGQQAERDFSTDAPTSGESENDYLGRLTCTGCGKRCSLLSPQCGRGMNQAEQASTYYESYMAGDASSSDSQSDAALKTYLGGLTCTGCSKHCSLLSPQCGTGVAEAQAATEEYNQSIATNSGESGDGSSQNGTGSSAGDSGSSASDSTGTNGNKNQLTLTFDYDEDDSLVGLLIDYGSIMGVYIAGTYYTLEIIERVKKKKKAVNRIELNPTEG